MKNKLFKLSSFFLIFILAPSLVEAKCNSNSIGVIHQSGFGISFGGGEGSAGSYDKNTVNVPLSIDGKLACFKKKNSYKIESKEKNKMIISPMEVDFENVPDPHFKQYIFMKKMTPLENSQVFIMNFVCSGENPLSTETISNSLFNIQKVNEMEMSTSSTFSSGVSAKILEGKKISEYQPNEAFQLFSQIYDDKKKSLETAPIETNHECLEINIPTLVSTQTTEAIEEVNKGISAEFTTKNAKGLNGCSKDFSSVMKSYLLENYNENESFKDFKIKKKWFSSDLVFEW